MTIDKVGIESDCIMIFRMQRSSATVQTVAFALFFLIVPFVLPRGMYHHPDYQIWFLRVIGPPIFFIVFGWIWFYAIKIDEKGVYGLYVWGTKELKTRNFIARNDIGRVVKTKQAISVVRKIPVPANIWFGPNRNVLVFSMSFDYAAIVRLIHERSPDARIDPDLVTSLKLSPKNSQEAERYERYKKSDDLNKRNTVFLLIISLLLGGAGAFVTYKGVSLGLEGWTWVGMISVLLSFVIWLLKAFMDGSRSD